MKLRRSLGYLGFFGLLGLLGLPLECPACLASSASLRCSRSFGRGTELKAAWLVQR